MNARSLANKSAKLEETLLLYDPHILAVTETWLNSQISDSEVVPPSHKIIRRDREARGGGVALILKNDINCFLLEDIPNHESLFCQLSYRSTSFLFGVVYRPPKSSVEYMELLSGYLERMVRDGQKFILTGDFNLPTIDWNTLSVPASQETASAQILLETLFFHSLKQIVMTPTRVAENTQSILDLVFIKHFHDNCFVETTTGVADHKLVHVTLNVRKEEVASAVQTYRDFLRANDESILDYLHFSLPDFARGGDVQLLWDKFKKIVTHCITEYVPIRRKKTQRQNPWITREIIHLKRRIRRKRKRSTQNQNHHEIRCLKDELTLKLQNARSTFYDQTLPSFLKESPEKFWRFLSNSKHTVDQLRIDGTVTNNLQNIANALNKCFQTSFTERDLHSSEDTIPAAFFGPSRMDDITISQEGIFSLLLKINVRKSSGADNIPTAFLQRYSELVSEYLYVLFNASLHQCMLPSDWLTAKVVPVFKSGDKLDPANYRPISLISTCCKIFEHIVASHIIQHLESKNFFVQYQHGFRKNVSTITQLVSVIHDFTSAVDNHLQIDAVFLDLSKAFDRVPHKLLIDKLKEIGLPDRMVYWIEAYLLNRTQFVQCTSVRSNHISVMSGVPQGSVLGPLLFLIFINDIAAGIDDTVTVKLFADDCVVYSVINDISSQMVLNESICKLSDWCDRRKMRINFTKTVCMTITTKRNPLPYVYKIGEQIIQNVSSTKYLGLTISNNLKWDAHIDNICAKAFRKLCFLRRKLRTSSKKAKLEAYRTLIRPVLEYASIVWDPFYAKDIARVERIQRLAARFIMHDYRSSSSVTNMLEQVELEPLHLRRQVARLKFFFLLYSNKIGLCRDTYIHPAPLRSTRLNNSKVVRPYFSRSKRFQMSYFPRTTEEWNALPECVVQCTNVNCFEKLLLTQLQ